MTDRVHTIVWLALLGLGIGLSTAQLGDTALTTPAVHAGHHHGNQHEPQRIFFWAPHDVQTLVLKATGGQEQKFIRDSPGKWTSTENRDASAFDVEAYVSLLSRARIDREFPADEEALGSFGLAPAQFRILVLDSEGAVLANLAVGERTPDGFGRYVQVPTDTNILIIPNYQFEEALKALRSDA
jgi:hypothetical protein